MEGGGEREISIFDVSYRNESSFLVLVFVPTRYDVLCSVLVCLQE